MTQDSTPLRRDEWQARTRRGLWACVAVLAVANFLLGPLMRVIQPVDPSAALVYALFGATAAQLGLSAIWCVLASARLARRLALGSLGGVILLVAWGMGLALHEVSLSGDNVLWERLMVALLCVPLLAIAAQTPLWIARYFFRWRVFHRRDPARRLPYESIGIRDILIAMGAVAVALSAARTGLMILDRATDSALLPLLIAALVVAAVSSFTTLPVLVATLRARRVWLALLTSWSVSLLIAFAVSGSWIVYRGRNVPWRDWGSFASMLAGFITCLSGVMLMVRRLGYRLYWGRRVALLQQIAETERLGVPSCGAPSFVSQWPGDGDPRDDSRIGTILP